MHLVVRQIDEVIYNLKFILNLTQMLICTQCFTWKLTHIVLNLLGNKFDGSHVLSVFG